MSHAEVFGRAGHETPGLGVFVAASILLHALLLLAVASYSPEHERSLPYYVRLIPPPAQERVSPPAGGEVLPPSVMEGPAVPKAAPETGSAGTKGGAAPVAPDRPGVSGPARDVPGIDALFDSAVLDRRAEDPVRDPREETGVTFDTTEIMLSGYMGLLKQKIESIWHYPREAAREGIYGDLKIRFVIRRDGTLGNVKLIRTSGHALLDQAALKALRDAEPYWPLPDGFEGEALTVNGRFIYTLSGWYVR